MPPPSSKNNDGYYMIATNIPLFQGINQLPIILDPIILDEGGGIEETLRRNNAKYHQNCRSLFNKTMLKRTRKTADCSNISSDDGKSKIRRTSIEGHMCFMRLNVSSMPPPSSNMMGSRIIGSWLIP
jgi:hypothetical protein